MENKLIFKHIIVIGLSYVTAILILNGTPVHYFLGFLFAVVMLAIFIHKPLYFLIGLFFLRSALDNFLATIRFSLGDIDLGLGGLVALALIIGTLFYISIYKDNPNRFKQLIVGLYFVFCLVSIMSFFITLDKVGAVKELVRRFSIFSILLLTMANINSEKKSTQLLKAIIFSAIIPLIVGSVIYIIRGGRFTGTFGHPNILAFYLLIIIGCVLTQVDCPHRHFSLSFSRKLYLGALVAALLLTLTRSAWASCCLMVGIYAFFFNKRLIIPVFCALIGIAFLPIVQERILNTFDVSAGSMAVEEMSSLGWRLNTWYYLFTEAIKRPFIGYGINATAYIGSYPAEAHNDYLRFFVESGIIGVLTYFLPYFYIFIYSVRNYRLFDKDSYLRKLALFFICFIPAFLLMSASENMGRYITVHWYFWGLVGIYFGLICLQRERENATEK